MEPVIPKMSGMDHVTHDSKADAAQNDEQGYKAVDHWIMDVGHKALIIAKKVEACIAEGGNGMPIPIIDALEAELRIKAQRQGRSEDPFHDSRIFSHAQAHPDHAAHVILVE